MLTRSAALSVKPPALATRWFVMFEDVVNPYAVVVESVEATFPKTDAKARRSQGSNNYFPDGSDIEGLNIVFYENKDFDTLKWITKWKNDVFDMSTGVYGYPAKYKKKVFIELYDYSQNRAIVTLEYQNCWPTTTGNLALNYEDPNGRLQIMQQFSVDSLIMR